MSAESIKPTTWSLLHHQHVNGGGQYGAHIRDRDDKTLTPLDQGSSQADIDTTAQIRKEIIADKNMSMDAKNVKIITLTAASPCAGRSIPSRKTPHRAIAVRIAPRGRWTTNSKSSSPPATTNLVIHATKKRKFNIYVKEICILHCHHTLTSRSNCRSAQSASFSNNDISVLFPTRARP